MFKTMNQYLIGWSVVGWLVGLVGLSVDLCFEYILSNLNYTENPSLEGNPRKKFPYAPFLGALVADY